MLQHARKYCLQHHVGAFHPWYFVILQSYLCHLDTYVHTYTHTIVCICSWAHGGVMSSQYWEQIWFPPCKLHGVHVLYKAATTKPTSACCFIYVQCTFPSHIHLIPQSICSHTLNKGNTLNYGLNMHQYTAFDITLQHYTLHAYSITLGNGLLSWMLNWSNYLKVLWIFLASQHANLSVYIIWSLDSTTTTSGVLSWSAQPTDDHDPRMHITAERKRLKLSLTRSQPMVVL